MGAPIQTTRTATSPRRRLRAIVLALHVLALVLLLTTQLGIPPSSWLQHLPSPHIPHSIRLFFTHNCGADDDDFYYSSPSSSPSSSSQAPVETEASVTLVIASQTTDNTSWAEGTLPSNWHSAIYAANNPTTTTTTSVPQTGGNVAMVYLSYIIDNYYKLSDINVFYNEFSHSWSKDADKLSEGLRSIRRLQLSHSQLPNNANMRCAWLVHPPQEETAVLEEESVSAAALGSPAAALVQDFAQLFPELAVPTDLDTRCCAQFAVTRERIRQRSRGEYERLRNWLLETSLPDAVGVKLLESAWGSGMDSDSNPNSPTPMC